MGTITELEGALQLVLETSATEHGITSGWQQRRGQLSPSQFVQTLVFGFLEDPHATLGRLARVAHAVGALVTPQALSQRFTPAAVALRRGVLTDALGVLLEAEPVSVALLQAFPGGVYLNDATQLALHDDWQEAWPGGGRAGLQRGAGMVRRTSRQGSSGRVTVSRAARHARGKLGRSIARSRSEIKRATAGRHDAAV
jgi:hypothetical protein